MKYNLNKKILKVYLDNTDMIDKKEAWKVILQKAQNFNISGATVYKAVAGVGSNKELHTFDILNLSQTMPLIIEIIDDKEKILTFLKNNKELFKNFFITLQDLEVITFED
jgi:PII-like signaling protein